MQIQPLRIPSYRSLKVNDTTPAEAVKRRRQLEPTGTCGPRAAVRRPPCGPSAGREPPTSDGQHATGSVARHGLAALSRRPQRTRPRQWTPAHQRQVWTLRRHYPFMGKRPLRVLLARQGIHLSESTVGRILAKGVRWGVSGLRFLPGACQAEKAPLLPPGPRPTLALRHPGHPTRPTSSRSITCRCPSTAPISRSSGPSLRSATHGDPCLLRATARNAQRFLQAVIEDLPFPLHSVQVDGGSEFRAEFEQASQQLDIPQFVLPPRRPQFNGCVERANDSARVEFWNLYTGELTVAAAGAALTEYQHFYNHLRPHRTLDMRTPMEYLATWKAT